MALTFSRRDLLGRILGFANVGLVAPAYAASDDGNASHRYGLSLLDIDPNASDGKDNTNTFEKAITEVQKNNLRSVQNIDFSSCWFENAGNGVAGSDGANVNGCRFVSMGDIMAAASFESKCTGAANGNVFAGAKTKKSMAVVADDAVPIRAIP